MTLDRLIHSFALSLSSVINILDPDIVVLGGGLSNIPLLYTDGLEAVAEKVFNDTCHTRIVQNKLGDSAGVYGAASLTLTQDRTCGP